MKNLLLSILFIFLFFGCNKDEDQPIENFPEVTACFTWDPLEPGDGIIQFLNCSDSAATYFWNFGDGTTLEEEEPVHTYGKADSIYLVTLIAYNGTSSDTISTEVMDEYLTRKPNIYIYPKESLSLCLTISFPLGGKVVRSIPEYGEGWCFDVTPSGIINNEFDCLFYESLQPDKYQFQKGWCIKQEDLKLFFEGNMIKYNFSQEEIHDFTEYWIPRLTTNEYYKIYPQTKEIIDLFIQLNFSIEPDYISRMFYVIERVDSFIEIAEPTIQAFDRNEFYVMEWGVVLK